MLKFLETKSTTLSPNVFTEKFHKKKILVMGSGPSVNTRNWRNIQVDGICTTSFFYLNDEIRNLSSILHITLTDIVDLTNKNLLEFLDKNDSVTIGFEPKEHLFYRSAEYTLFNERYKERIVFYNTTHGMKEGVAGRLCYFVLSFAPSELYYVGIDGRSQDIKNDPKNAFRTYLNGDPDNYPFKDFMVSHEYFAKTIHEYSKLSGTRIFNLGEGLPYNLSTPFSSNNFPLSQEVLFKITKE